MNQDYRGKIYEHYLTTTYAPRNNLSKEGLERAARYYAALYKSFLPTNLDASILDLGCGSGAFLLCCRQLGYRHIVGVDISPEQVAFCYERGLKDVTCMDALTFLQKNTDLFDLVVMNDIIEHMSKDEALAVLVAVYSRLQKGGRVIIRVPNLSNPMNIRTRYVDLTHEIGFTKESLQQILRVSGFSIDSIFGEFTPHRRWLARWLFDDLLLRGFKFFLRHTMHLYHEVVPGKNLIAIGSNTS